MSSIILFPHEARAAAAGTLRQIWRPMKVQPFDGKATFEGKNVHGQFLFYPLSDDESVYDRDDGLRKAPYQSGDILAVKETWRYGIAGARIIYRAESLIPDLSAKWSSPVTMPLGAVRFWPRVTGVAARRVQEMAEEDAKAWGVAPSNYDGFLGGAAITWDARFAKRGLDWGKNPWCFVTAVEMADRPEG